MQSDFPASTTTTHECNRPRHKMRSQRPCATRLCGGGQDRAPSLACIAVSGTSRSSPHVRLTSERQAGSHQACLADGLFGRPGRGSPRRRYRPPRNVGRSREPRGCGRGAQSAVPNEGKDVHRSHGSGTYRGIQAMGRRPEPAQERAQAAEPAAALKESARGPTRLYRAPRGTYRHRLERVAARASITWASRAVFPRPGTPADLDRARLPAGECGVRGWGACGGEPSVSTVSRPEIVGGHRVGQAVVVAGCGDA